VSLTAYKNALSKKTYESLPDTMRAPSGSKWNVPSTSAPKSSSENIPTGHTETPGFDGDRVLANSILFMLEYGWWLEAAYAIPEGDIGRFWEIMKVEMLNLI
jgi:hypothetical protein